MLAKVLIVEDNPINVIVLKKFIENICTPDTVTSGQKALEMLEKNKYDLVLMDINLGSEQMTGLDVLQKLRENPNLKDLPVIAVTAYSGDESVQGVFSDQFTDLVIKPIDKEKILSVITKYLPQNP
jgi:CheY-like chemotaxis protein